MDDKKIRTHQRMHQSLHAIAVKDDTQKKEGWCLKGNDNVCKAIQEIVKTESISAENSIYKEILSAFPDMVWAKDTKGNYIYANNAICENLLMCDSKEVIGNNDIYFATREREKYKDIADWHTFGELCFNSDLEVLEQKQQLKFMEYGNIRGKMVYLEVHKAPLYNKNKKAIGVVGIGRDVTEIEKIKVELKQKAFFDDLTKLPNRFVLDNDLQNILNICEKQKEISSLMFLDIDDFKHINNEFGHIFGDEFLISLAERFGRMSHSLNNKIYRFNSDEFAIVSTSFSTNLVDARRIILAIAETIRLEVAKEVCLLEPSKKTISATCSIGVYIIDSSLNNIGYIKSCADIAKNEAKSRGKNRVVIFEEIQRTTMVNILDTQKRINKGLVKEEFSLHYQPQYKTTDSNEFILVGAEALIRWHSSSIMLSPSYLIDIAEKSGQIIKLGKWIIKEGFNTLEQWSKDKSLKHLTLAINVSPKQFHYADFVENIIDLKKDYTFDNSKLKIEITENIAIENIEETITKMTILSDLGISLSLDDFGTGYSSLSNLTNLPFSQIKIDKSFIDDIVECEDSRQVIKSISDITKQMKKTLIIESVETKSQLDVLLDIGAREFQGYLLGKPMKLSEFNKIPRNIVV